jgi:hypothetical protein
LESLPIEPCLLHNDTELPGAPELVHNFSGMEKRFGGYATDMKASAAEHVVFLDDNRFEPELTGANRCDIAAWTATEDREIVNTGLYHISPSPMPGSSS